MALTLEEKQVLKAQRIEAKKQAKEAAEIEREKNQKPVKKIVFSIEWKKSRIWGANPHMEAKVYYHDGTFDTINTTTSGCGYDKESTVIAQGFNAVMKYKLWALPYESFKNGSLPYGIHAYSVDSRTYGYGIGTSCYYKIAEAIGGEFKNIASGKTFDVYEYNDLESPQDTMSNTKEQPETNVISATDTLIRYPVPVARGIPRDIQRALDILIRANYFVGPVWTREDIKQSIEEQFELDMFTPGDIDSIRERIETRLAKHGEGMEWDIVNEEVRCYAHEKGKTFR